MPCLAITFSFRKFMKSTHLALQLEAGKKKKKSRVKCTKISMLFPFSVFPQYLNHWSTSDLLHTYAFNHVNSLLSFL